MIKVFSKNHLVKFKILYIGIINISVNINNVEIIQLYHINQED